MRWSLGRRGVSETQFNDLPSEKSCEAQVTKTEGLKGGSFKTTNTGPETRLPDSIKVWLNIILLLLRLAVFTGDF